MNEQTSIFIDIGSSVIKILGPNVDGTDYPVREFHDRDYDISVYEQIMSLLKRYWSSDQNTRFLICSSANGGLRVGLVCLSERFSGRLASRLVLSAGANVVFATTMSEATVDSENSQVDALIVVGGIDCPDVPLMSSKLASFDRNKYKFQTLIYAGNKYLADQFQSTHPDAILVKNPLGEDLTGIHEELLHKIRSLYLDDLVDKEHVTELQQYSEVPIWPTPAVVGLAYEDISKNSSRLRLPNPFMVFDIGGATTDVHFGLELVENNRSSHDYAIRSFNRHVFTELGVKGSRDVALNRLLSNDRVYEFLRVLYGSKASRIYADLRDGEVEKDLLFYSCFFLAMDSLVRGSDPSVPQVSAHKVGAILLTGGVSQVGTAVKFRRITGMFLPEQVEDGIPVFLDKSYEVWAEGMTLLADAEHLGS